mmetsp:Transcript_45508/g.115622  ORF Transcript_45508/g.115622 Transcript_45508/m.115622 type:complete len:237 (-) Transcript_45508:909-1619(-)
MAPSRMSAPISEVRPAAQQCVVWRRQKCGRKPCRAWGDNEEVARVAGDRDGGSSGGAAGAAGRRAHPHFIDDLGPVPRAQHLARAEAHRRQTASDVGRPQHGLARAAEIGFGAQVHGAHRRSAERLRHADGDLQARRRPDAGQRFQIDRDRQKDATGLGRQCHNHNSTTILGRNSGSSHSTDCAQLRHWQCDGRPDRPCKRAARHRRVKHTECTGLGQHAEATWACTTSEAAALRS